MIDLLKVYNVGEKIRIGNYYDGGYVVPKVAIEKSECLFSYGIKDDISFDEHYIELTDFKNKAYGYDHTIDSVPTKYANNFQLFKEGISGKKEQYTDNFISHYEQLGINGKAFLKIDVEGAEYEFFNNTNILNLKNKVSCIAIEFHSLQDDNYRNQFWDIVKGLNEYFYLCHIHGNSCDVCFLYEEDKFKCIMPNVIELTFVEKSIIDNVCLDECDFPTELDNTNAPTLPDYDLSFIREVNFGIKTYSDLKNMKIEDNGSIPKFIFRTGNSNIKDLNKEIKDLYINELINNKEYKIFYFDDKDCEDFIKDTQNEDIIKCYNKLIPTAFKADLWRYCILNKYGGIYMDLSHKSLVEYNDIVSNENEIFLKDKRDECGINNSFIATCKGNKVLQEAIRLCIENIKKGDVSLRVYDITGPQLLERAFRNVYNIGSEHQYIQQGMESIKLRLFDYDNQNPDINLVILNEKGEEVVKYRTGNHYEVLYYNNNIIRYPELYAKKIIYKDDRWNDIDNLYKIILKRDSDLGGVYNYYISKKSIKEIEDSIKESEEYKNITKI